MVLGGTAAIDAFVSLYVRFVVEHYCVCRFALFVAVIVVSHAAVAASAAPLVPRPCRPRLYVAAAATSAVLVGAVDCFITWGLSQRLMVA